MTLKNMFVLFFAAMFIIPFYAIAEDDFEDDGFGGFDDVEEEKFDEFDAEASAEKKKEKDQEASDAAMKDLLGDEETFDKEEEPKKESKKEESKKDTPKKEKKAKEPKEKGLKPVILVKGGFTLLGQYKQIPVGGTVAATYGSMFGSVDEGLIGAEFIGDHVIAKGTLNVRTLNPLLTKGNNPLAKANLHAIQDGLYNGLYEIYGGLKFYDVFIKAGKMVPEYGLMDTYQKIGMGFTTPFLTRSLVAVEGFIPETDEGFSLGYKGTFADEHTILVGFMFGTGSVASDWWETDKVMGIYGRLGYMHEYFQAAFGFQYRTDYFNDSAFTTKLKQTKLIGIGVHLNASVKGFEMPLTFDFSQFELYQKTGAVATKKPVQNILLSLAPGYAYSFDSEWADKIGLAIRFDLIRGVYSKGAGYLDYGTTNVGGASFADLKGYKSESVIFRLGATLNFFAKDIKGVRSFAGITFLVQPGAKIVGKSATQMIIGETDYGFTTLMLSAGAEM